MTRGLYSLLIGVIVVLAVPVSQLRLVSVRVECCCPDQSRCHCPDHGTQGPEAPTINVCHKTSETIASAEAPAFAAPDLVAIHAPPMRIAVVEYVVSQPHAAPSPERLPGPS